jgi:hypothetical protein
MNLTAPRSPAFSIADLEAYDGAAPDGARERRFLCPLCGEGKPKNREHRSLCANVQTGAWNCKRCAATGKLSDFWSDGGSSRPKLKPRDLARRQLAQRFALPAETTYQSTVEIDATGAADWREQLAGARLIEDETGAAYLLSRGITLRAACFSTVLHAPRFYGRPAIVFPLRDFAGHLTGASGRYFHANATPKTRIAGKKRDGIFTAPVIEPSGRVFFPFAANVPGVIVTEAPIDALSLASAGYPAISLCGTSAPGWMYRACAFKRVLLAFDADAAGDKAAASLEAILAPYGAACERLRPEGGKDWNEVLQRDGRESLSDWLAYHVL